MATWPATLPQKPTVDGFRGGPQPNKISFQPEVGPSIDRRRGTAAGHVFDVTFPPMTVTQRATFETFYHDTLIDGTQSFVWDDPTTCTEYSWKFVGAYSWDRPGRLARLSCQLMRLP